MIGACAGLDVCFCVPFQVPRPFPGFALVVGEGYRKTVASCFQVVIDQQPEAVSQHEHFNPRAGVGPIGVSPPGSRSRRDR